MCKLKVVLSLLVVMNLIVTTQSKAQTQAPNQIEVENLKTVEAFNEEISRFTAFLKTEFNTNIHLSKEWNNEHPTFSASAMNMTGKVIQVSGFDYRSNTLGAFRLGLCHETGHYLAGAPYLKINPNSIENTINRMDLSAEGQADYFAPYCLKKYVEYLNQNGFSPKNTDTYPEVIDFCKQSNQAACEYTATAALDLINYLNSNYVRAGQNNPPMKLENYKDTTPTSYTLNGRREYPTLNCRLRTYLAGTVCDNNRSSVSQFICNSGPGSRPDCWFVN
ncbi:MAG: hypothetical protein ACXVCL_07505 [Bdellovibrio sp.]